MTPIPDPTLDQIDEIVIDELRGIPYPRSHVTPNSPLGGFLFDVDAQDKRNNAPVSRVEIFLRKVKERIGQSRVVLANLLDTDRYPTVGDLAQELWEKLL